MTNILQFVKTALLGVIAVLLIFLLVKIEYLTTDRRHSLVQPEESYRIHEPRGRLTPKSDPSPSYLPKPVNSTIFV